MTKHKKKILSASVMGILLIVSWFLSGNGISPLPKDLPVDTIVEENEAVTDSPKESGDFEEASEIPDESLKPSAEIQEKTVTQTESPIVSQSTQMEINPETGKDKYLTDPVPEGKPIPVEPQDAVIGEKALTCVLSVRCDTILNNMHILDGEKHELVPENGVIFPETEVIFYEGESVFNLLQREMKKAKIHMEFVNTPIYNSAYIEGINNLYEFDTGELSGWMYKVNGWFPNYGCSRYVLKDGDLVEWVYTCDLGHDVGGGYSVGE